MFLSFPTLSGASDSLLQDASENAWVGVTFDSTFANGTTIPAGSYRTLVRALKVTGNPADESEYETWLSPVIVKST